MRRVPRRYDMPRLTQALWLEFNVSMISLLGSLLLLGDGLAIIKTQSFNAVPLLFASTVAMISSVLPWAWPGLSMSYRRAILWSSWSVGTITATAALQLLQYQSLLGTQALLCSAVLMEMNGRPSALRWFWGTLLALGLAILAYYMLTPLRPLPD